MLPPNTCGATAADVELSVDRTVVFRFRQRVDFERRSHSGQVDVAGASPSRVANIFPGDAELRRRAGLDRCALEYRLLERRVAL